VYVVVVPPSVWVNSLLYEQGGEALLRHLRELPPDPSSEAQEALRLLIGYFENNRHRTDYRLTGARVGTSAAVPPKRGVRSSVNV
jgi:hypothetical protein